MSDSLCCIVCQLCIIWRFFMYHFAIAFGVSLCVVVHHLAFHCAPVCNSIWCFIVCHCASFGVSLCTIWHFQPKLFGLLSSWHDLSLIVLWMKHVCSGFLLRSVFDINMWAWHLKAVMAHIALWSNYHKHHGFFYMKMDETHKVWCHWCVINHGFVKWSLFFTQILGRVWPVLLAKVWTGLGEMSWHLDLACRK
jgi:hypothetical protein